MPVESVGQKVVSSYLEKPLVKANIDDVAHLMNDAAVASRDFALSLVARGLKGDINPDSLRQISKDAFTSKGEFSEKALNRVEKYAQQMGGKRTKMGKVLERVVGLFPNSEEKVEIVKPKIPMMQNVIALDMNSMIAPSFEHIVPRHSANKVAMGNYSIFKPEMGASSPQRTSLKIQLNDLGESSFKNPVSLTAKAQRSLQGMIETLKSLGINL